MCAAAVCQARIHSCTESEKRIPRPAGRAGKGSFRSYGRAPGNGTKARGKSRYTDAFSHDHDAAGGPYASHCTGVFVHVENTCVYVMSGSVQAIETGKMACLYAKYSSQPGSPSARISSVCSHSESIQFAGSPGQASSPSSFRMAAVMVQAAQSQYFSPAAFLFFSASIARSAASRLPKIAAAASDS